MIGELIQPYARIVATLRWLIGWESVYWSGSVLAGLVIGERKSFKSPIYLRK